MVRVFEAGIGVYGRGCGQIGTKLHFVEKRTGVLPLPTVGAVAHDAGTVRQQLCDRRLRNCRVKAFHVLPDAVVEREFALFAQLSRNQHTFQTERSTATVDRILREYPLHLAQSGVVS